MDKLIALLDKTDFQGEMFPLCVDLLWNVLEKHQAARDILGNFQTIKIMKGVLSKMLDHGYRTKDKELRNDILVVILKKRTER